MLRIVRGKALELLSEFFENVQKGKHVEQHVNLSVFGGLFGTWSHRVFSGLQSLYVEEEHIELHGLYLRREVINALHLPLLLKCKWLSFSSHTDGICYCAAGFVGRLKIEGFHSTNVRAVLEDVCLVLGQNPGRCVHRTNPIVDRVTQHRQLG